MLLLCSHADQIFPQLLLTHKRFSRSVLGKYFSKNTFKIFAKWLTLDNSSNYSLVICHYTFTQRWKVHSYMFRPYNLLLQLLEIASLLCTSKWGGKTLVMVSSLILLYCNIMVMSDSQWQLTYFRSCFSSHTI